MAEGKPRYGVKLVGGGVVLYWGDVPVTTREMADKMLAELTRLGYQGEVVSAATQAPGPGDERG